MEKVKPIFKSLNEILDENPDLKEPIISEDIFLLEINYKNFIQYVLNI